MVNPHAARTHPEQQISPMLTAEEATVQLGTIFDRVEDDDTLLGGAGLF